jgi:alkylation response protein AidB-like acyl-CoA dehydrogenase
MSEEGRGVSGISNMLQITRIHNAVGSAGAMRRSHK